MRLALWICLYTAMALPSSSCIAPSCAMCDEPVASGDEVGSEEQGEQVNLVFKTSGGTQFWTDHLHRDGFRIQRHALTGHWRLLDAENVRRGWGTRQQCETALDAICPVVEGSEPQHVVVLLHGLMRTRESMNSLGSKLGETSSAQVIRFSYASTRASIGEHALALRDVLENMPDQTTFSFVGHSMGNIVVRHALGDLQRDDPASVLPRCRSMVMLGPPNQGASIARRLARTGVFGLISGKGAIELGPKWQELESRLAIPPFPFAIIAGDLSHNPIGNPLVDGASDSLVSVDEARLDGAEWFKTVPVVHRLLMNDPGVQELTAEFVRCGGWRLEAGGGRKRMKNEE